MAKDIVFFDTEVGIDDKKIHDIGAVRSDKATLHTASVSEFCAFAAGSEFLCGHNAVHHDMKYLAPLADGRLPKKIIDTLYLSPLLFPKKPYHRLLKDDKLQVEELNNPVNDSQKAQALFFDEVNAFRHLPIEKKKIFCGLLYNFEEFCGFFDYVEFKPYAYKMAQMILETYKGKICENADVELLIKEKSGDGVVIDITTPHQFKYSIKICLNNMKLITAERFWENDLARIFSLKVSDLVLFRSIY